MPMGNVRAALRSCLALEVRPATEWSFHCSARVLVYKPPFYFSDCNQLYVGVSVRTGNDGGDEQATCIVMLFTGPTARRTVGSCWRCNLRSSLLRTGQLGVRDGISTDGRRPSRRRGRARDEHRRAIMRGVTKPVGYAASASATMAGQGAAPPRRWARTAVRFTPSKRAQVIAMEHIAFCIHRRLPAATR
jgi:hypothetical protein